MNQSIDRPFDRSFLAALNIGLPPIYSVKVYPFVFGNYNVYNAYIIGSFDKFFTIKFLK
jgi:hypothetical protein